LRRLAVTVPASAAEEARAVMVGLFPEGFEERDDGGALELAAYTKREDAQGLLAALGPVEVAEVAGGWEDEWRRFHRPVRVGQLWIGPSWETVDAGATPVVIEPGRAFGTGAHATTRLCLELLLDLSPTSLVDVGCGSGVVAVAAASSPSRRSSLSTTTRRRSKRRRRTRSPTASTSTSVSATC
jgi:ribosomal protein L11 methyltransferase